METKKLTTKLKMFWALLWAKQSTLIFQRHVGGPARSLGAGAAELEDLVMFAAEFQRCYESQIEMINDVATQSGELHTLQALRAAIDQKLGDQ